MEPARVVAARVPFMPTSQSASLRARAASSSGFISLSGRSALKASWIAALVMLENQARSTGLSCAAAGALCRMSLKMSSPSRPASHALTISVTSLRDISLCSDANCLAARLSRAWYRNSVGMIGRSSYVHLRKRGSYSSGSTCSSR